MSESSSEDENSARLKEAVWHFGPHDAKINGKGENDRQSRRVDVSKHEHDGNELGTTPEFQSHVAKKLGAILDGCISEVFSETVDSEPCQSKNRDEDNEEGFRLFSTSTSGKWEEQSPPPPPKRRPISSSSDSDSEMEMRLREAAVSVSDILGPLAQTSTETTDRKSMTNVECEKDTVTKKTKKKKKRKTSTEGSEEKCIHVSEKQSNGEATTAQTTVVENLAKKKKKKKKRKKLEDGKKGADE